MAESGKSWKMHERAHLTFATSAVIWWLLRDAMTTMLAIVIRDCEVGYAYQSLGTIFEKCRTWNTESCHKIMHKSSGGNVLLCDIVDTLMVSRQWSWPGEHFLMRLSGGCRVLQCFLVQDKIDTSCIIDPAMVSPFHPLGDQVTFPAAVVNHACTIMLYRNSRHL